MIGRILIRYSTTAAKTIPSAKMYIERFSSLQITLKQQRKKIQEIKLQVKLAQQAQQMTITDHLSQSLSKLTGRNFESKAVARLKEDLIQYRQELENKIHESDLKWEKPRQEIIKLRKSIADQFLTKFVALQQNLLKNCSYETSPQLVQGLALIHRLLISTLEKHGVHFFEPEAGQQFDPELFDTVDKGEKGQPIKKVVSRGWKINQKVIKKPIVQLQ